MNIKITGLLCVVMLTTTGVVAANEPAELTATPAANLLRLPLNEYELSWSVDRQHGFRVLVAGSEEALNADAGNLWDSGHRHRMHGRCAYQGVALPPGRTAWWKVRTWDEAGRPSPWSAPAHIEVPAAPEAKAALRENPMGHSPGRIEFIEGRKGKALRNRKDSPRIWSEDYPGLWPKQGTTLCAWIRPERAGDAWQCIYRKEDGNARRLLALGKGGSTWGLWTGLGINGRYQEFGAAYPKEHLLDGQWHHVGVTFDGKHIRLFVDGRPIGEQKQAGVLDGGGSGVGHIGSFSGRDEIFEGGIDELRIYAKGLDAAEMKALAAGEDPAAESLTAHWPLDGSIDNAVRSTLEAVRNRVALLGGTRIFNMEQYGFFETAVTVRWPQHDLSFRNLGWPADDVFGTARSEFGSARNTRSWKPPGAEAGFGFQELMKQVRTAQPTTLIVGYGAEAAFADTPEKMADWQAGYTALIKQLGETGARLILLTPVQQAKHTPTLPNPDDHNQRLRQAAKFITSVGEEQSHHVVDLNAQSFTEPSLGKQYLNGIHLNERGHRTLAALLVAGLKLREPAIWVNTDPPRCRTGEINRTETMRRGWRFDLRLDQLPGPETEVIVPSKDHALQVRIDGEESGSFVDGAVHNILGPDHAQAEQLRRTIVEKNRFHRYTLRPINKAYIFLFRRHEMGHLADEMKDFDELIAGRERVIANLRVPRRHTWEIERIEHWKSPRNYPDHEVPKNIPAPDPAAELAAFTIAEGFELNLFARDPMIANPINLNWDTRGRAWVATSTTYPHIKPGEIPNDRIVILEDRDGDGVADHHTVFAENLTVPQSVMPVPGGAYVCSTTEFLFLADEDGDDVSESRRVIYSGFGNADVHHMIHGLRWAPWGDLYFTQSIYINSFVDTPHGPRRMNGSGTWRFRPKTERLDAFATGMVNPWGFAFNRSGQSFGTDGAGGSGPHYVFPGSAHPTAIGAHRVLKGLVPGKPKNTAAEFMSGRHLPDHWQGSLLANDFRANRTVRYELAESGSGYTAKEVETVLHSSHRSFRPVDIKMGPDGAVYIVDWYNPIIDHGEVDFHHPLRDKSHGRIWQLTAKGRPLVERPRIADAKAEALLQLLEAPEQYTRIQANRELASRSCQGLGKPFRAWLAGLDPQDPLYDQHRLEGLWLYMARRAPNPKHTKELLRSPDHRVRAAVVRVLSNWNARGGDLDVEKLLGQAVEDPHPQVRLEAINALRATGTLEGAKLALRALGHPVDDNINFALELTVRELSDQWLPAMQAGKPVFDGDPSRLAYALKEVNDPRAMPALVEVVQRGELDAEDLPHAVTTISALGGPADLDAMLALAGKQPALLTAIARGAVDNSNVPTNPQALMPFFESQPVTASQLAGAWKHEPATARLLEIAGTGEDDAMITAACQALAQLGDLTPLQRFAGPDKRPALRAAAVAAWARRHAETAAITGSLVLSSLKDAGQAEAVFAAFIAHQNGPEKLAHALQGVKLEEAVAIAGVRLAHASGRELPGLIRALNQAGGLKTVAQSFTPEERASLLADATAQGDFKRGRAIFQRKSLACVSCHIIDRQGGKLGPDLSTVGSYMTPASLLESLVNPSTDIKQGYETVMITKKDRGVMAGLLQRKTGSAHLVRDPSGKVVSIANRDIAKVDSSPVSLMPPGLTSQLRRDELVDLLGYLIGLGKRK